MASDRGNRDVNLKVLYDPRPSMVGQTFLGRLHPDTMKLLGMCCWSSALMQPGAETRQESGGVLLHLAADVNVKAHALVVHPW